MDYRQAVDYLNTETAEGIKPDITRITMLCELLSNPEYAYPVIHVTGTNGKTTVSRLIQIILRGLGIKTGLYTSPHLVSYTERCSVDGVDISEDDFARIMTELVPVITKTNQVGFGGAVTQFEALTALGFAWLREQAVDAAVIEVGMGGRWDATNVVNPDVAVITNVALEHTERLGHTVEEIAVEKAGIIKKDSTVLTAAEQSSVIDIIERKCAVMNADLKRYGRDFDIIDADKQPDGNRYLTVKGLNAIYYDVPLVLRGGHQIDNTVITIAAAEEFVGKRKPELLPKFAETINKWLLKAVSPGRLEIASKQPFIVLDGAHNPNGAARVANALPTDFEYHKLSLVLAVLDDKDIDGIVGELVPLADRCVVTSVQSPRAMDKDKLAAAVSKYCRNVTTADSVASAIKIAAEGMGKKDMILVTGSLYTVGEAKEALSKP